MAPEVLLKRLLYYSLTPLYFNAGRPGWLTDSHKVGAGLITCVGSTPTPALMKTILILLIGFLVATIALFSGAQTVPGKMFGFFVGLLIIGCILFAMVYM